MKSNLWKRATVLVGVIVLVCATAFVFILTTNRSKASELPQNDFIFLHHSVGQHWLDHGLRDSLAQKPYIDNVDDTFYGTYVPASADRPHSLSPRPGDFTDANHWLFWFNDYFDGIKNRDNPAGFLETNAEKVEARVPAAGPVFNWVTGEPVPDNNKIVMFKSCFLDNNIEAGATGAVDPFSDTRTFANHQAIFRHPDGTGNTYTHNGYTYKPLEDIFAENPDTLFIFATNPPSHFGPKDATTDENANLNREFNAWLKNEWLPGYNEAHPGLNNVVIFDLHDTWAYPQDHPEHPNRLRAEFGGDSGDSHPNQAANVHATEVFAANPDNFIDQVWNQFQNGK